MSKNATARTPHSVASIHKAAPFHSGPIRSACVLPPCSSYALHFTPSQSSWARNRVGEPVSPPLYAIIFLSNSPLSHFRILKVPLCPRSPETHGMTVESLLLSCRSNPHVKSLKETFEPEISRVRDFALQCSCIKFAKLRRDVQFRSCHLIYISLGSLRPPRPRGTLFMSQLALRLRLRKFGRPPQLCPKPGRSSAAQSKTAAPAPASSSSSVCS